MGERQKNYRPSSSELARRENIENPLPNPGPKRAINPILAERLYKLGISVIVESKADSEEKKEEGSIVE